MRLGLAVKSDSRVGKRVVLVALERVRTIRWINRPQAFV